MNGPLWFPFAPQEGPDGIYRKLGRIVGHGRHPVRGHPLSAVDVHMYDGLLYDRPLSLFAEGYIPRPYHLTHLSRSSTIIWFDLCIKARQAPDDDESSQAMEGLHEIVCRLAQGHPTQTPKRWHLITRKLNRAMRKRKIPAQPLKALFAKEGLCIPKCWVAEKTQEAIKKELAAANQHMEKNKGIFGRPLFGKKKSIAEQHQGGSKSGEDADQAGESDTEPESDIDEDVVRGAGNGDTTELAYKYEPLSKYEVFSFMRRVHDRIGPGMVETDEVIEEIQRAENMVNMMYEDLPADKLKAISQQNRIRSSLREDSFVYGEITLLSFLQV